MLQIFALLLQIFALLLQIFVLLLQIFALLFGIKCTETNQSQSSNISMYIIIGIIKWLRPRESIEFFLHHEFAISKYASMETLTLRHNVFSNKV